MNRADNDPGADDQDGNESFLQRWSRRKSQLPESGEELSAIEPADEDAPAIGNEAEARGELTDADMPDIESLDEESDYAGFLSPKVSEQLRKQALQKLFHLPAFNITDGLNDYDEDYTRFEGLGDIVTHEMQRMLLREAKAALSAESSPDEEAAAVENAAPAMADDMVAADSGDRQEGAGKDEVDRIPPE